MYKPRERIMNESLTVEQIGTNIEQNPKRITPFG